MDLRRLLARAGTAFCGCAEVFPKVWLSCFQGEEVSWLVKCCEEKEKKRSNASYVDFPESLFAHASQLLEGI